MRLIELGSSRGLANALAANVVTAHVPQILPIATMATVGLQDHEFN